MRERELSFEERATWGECPACHAKDGQPCDPSVGIAVGQNIYGQPPQEGAHLGRLQAAPFRVRLVPA